MRKSVRPHGRGGAGAPVARLSGGGSARLEEATMRSLRSAGAALLLALASLGLVAATPGRAEAYHYRWHGAHHYPYHWNRGYYNPYAGYGYGYGSRFGYGSYYGASPYCRRVRSCWGSGPPAASR